MRRHSALFRITAIVTTMAMLTVAMPVWAFAPTHAPDPSPEPAEAKKSKKLTADAMGKLKGRLGENPYISGTQRYSVIMGGVDLLTQNFTTAATDLSFEGGYGIPVNVTRSYSANEADQGPFGKGWILSTDIRTTAGGLLKSDKSGDRATPVHIKQFPFDQQASDTSFANSERIAITDASGRETDSKLDVDGILSGPLWDKNIYDSVYEDLVQNDQVYTILSGMTVTTPEGTVYVYTKQGAYVGDGMEAIGFAGTSEETLPTPSNILKIASITDRHGNATTFTYTTGESNYAYFRKTNGIAWENRLTGVSMPGGRSLTFTWSTLDADGLAGEGATTYPVKRIRYVSDGEREVEYQYDEGSFNVNTVYSPEEKTTTYTYADAHVNEAWTTSAYGSWIAGELLHSITDARGLATTIDYMMGTPNIPTLTTNPGLPAPCAYRVHTPNNQTLYTWTADFSEWKPDEESEEEWDDYPSTWDTPPMTHDFGFEVYVGSEATGTPIDRGGIHTAVVSNPGSSPNTFTVRMLDLDVNYNTTDPEAAIAGNPSWTKKYSLLSGDLLEEVSYIYPWGEGLALATIRGFKDTSIFSAHKVTATTTYNFLGNPLQKTIVESSPSTTKNVYFAYHGYDKYFQQKAVKDPAGRFSFTEYYDRDAADGKKGQVYRVYDPKWSNGFTNTGSGWQNAIVPSNTDLWSAEFDYDTDGRPTSVKKLKSGTVGSSGTYVRVQTVTTYGGTGTPFWGAAATVTEDYGSGKINRVTETISYDVSGRAEVTKDAAGKRFRTTYDLDGRVQSVEVDPAGGTSYSEILEYTYGTADEENGMPTLVIDKTDTNRWIKQTIGYADSGAAIGQPASVDEQWVSDPNGTPTTTTQYGVVYTYNSRGLRDTVLYDSPNGDRKWHYDDYVRVGSPESPNYAFQTLIEQTYSGGWSDSNERMFYMYDSAGRMAYSAFAPTRRTTWNSNGWDTDPGYYVMNNRALQVNDYDAAGRVLAVWNYWQDTATWNSGPQTVTYETTTKIQDGAVTYDYDSATGLRTAQVYKEVVSGAWSTDRTEYYGYDSSLDYLTSVDYNDGGSDEYRTWGYDAAGNRITDSAFSVGSWTYDNLNRMTATPKVIPIGSKTSWAYNNDILGNRTGRNSNQNDASAALYSWDVLNRMLMQATPSAGGSYHYRADGQRIEKVEGPTLDWVAPPPLSQQSGHYDLNYGDSNPTSRYFYDGQMGIEDDYNPSGTVTVVNRYALGARGIDRVEKYADSTTTYGYPLYDGHGNMRTTLARSGSSYSTGTFKTYDVWGSVRSGGDSNDPAQKYVANLGHVNDPESGLIYMRARYHEPATGRFVSEDPAMDGWNWFTYCCNDPVNRVDESGRTSSNAIYWVTAAGIIFGFWGSLIQNLLQAKDYEASWWTDAMWSGVYGGIAVYAAAWVRNWLERYVVGGFLSDRLADFAAGAGGLGMLALLYYAKRGGEVLYELFEMEYLAIEARGKLRRMRR